MNYNDDFLQPGTMKHGGGCNCGGQCGCKSRTMVDPEGQLDDFLGILAVRPCFGNKKCQERRTEKEAYRDEKRDLRLEKKRLKNEQMGADSALGNTLNDVMAALFGGGIGAGGEATDPDYTPPPPAEKDNTLTWVIVGVVAMMVIGAILFFVLKK